MGEKIKSPIMRHILSQKRFYFREGKYNVELGIDPGTKTWDFVLMDEGRIVREEVVPSERISLDMCLRMAEDADITVAPSGYGIPLKRVSELNGSDFEELLLKKEGEGEVMGLGKVLKGFQRENINGYVLPGVKHLPSVPEFRKINKIDMGTPDKLCVAALAASRNQGSFILAELGSAFNAFMAVENGSIVDGIGGTMASSGNMSSGAWDGELAYIAKIQKKTLFTGGKKDVPGKTGERYFIEGVVKDINSMLTAVDTDDVFVSGALSKDYIGEIKDSFPEARFLRGESKRASNAAEGAAMIANGLNGGHCRKIVEKLGIKEASGSLFDYIYIKSKIKQP